MDRSSVRIGELARLCGISPDTLRYYERLGLLSPAQRTATGYRVYDRTAVARVAFIRQAQALDLTLAEVGEIVAVAASGTKPCEHVQHLLTTHLDAVDSRITQLRSLRRVMKRLLALDESARTSHPCVCGLIESVRVDSRRSHRHGHGDTLPHARGRPHFAQENV